MAKTGRCLPLASSHPQITPSFQTVSFLEALICLFLGEPREQLLPTRNPGWEGSEREDEWRRSFSENLFPNKETPQSSFLN